jgi:biotin carboxyl carrier protein
LAISLQSKIGNRKSKIAIVGFPFSIAGEALMAYVAGSGGREHRLDVRSDRDGLRVRLDDRELQVDLLRVDPALYSLLIDGRSYEIDVLETEEALMVLVDGQPFRVEIQDEQERRLRAAVGKGDAKPAKRVVSAPMPGKVVKLLVRPGDAVQAGDGVIVVEAMKMENELKAPAAGTVKEVRVEEGKPVSGGDVLVVIE